MSRTALLATAALLVAAATPAAVVGSAEAAKAKPKPRLSATAASVAEGTGKAVVTLRLAKKAKQAVKVAWRTGDGTAKAGADYTAAKGTATIKKGRKSTTLSIVVLDDPVHEGIETFTVRLTSSRVKVPAKPVTVTLTDDDAAGQPNPPTPPTPPAPPATAPSALTGTVTVSRTAIGFPMGTTTLTMNLRLVPTSTAGEWRDDGTGSWTTSGVLTGFTMPPCPTPTTTVSGAGTFLTSAGPATAGKAALVLSSFDPLTGAGTPEITWQGAAPNTSVNYVMLPPMPPDFISSCSMSTSNGTTDFSMAAPGATGTHTGSTGPTRGVSFSYSTPPGAEILTVTGSLTPVP